MKTPNPDVIVIQKQTAIERYTKRNLNFAEYLEKDGRNKHLEAHNAHLESQNILLHALKKLNVSFEMYNLDELQSGAFEFFNGSPQSGLQPARKLVVSLGGDGTLLHTSHHCGGNVSLLGINSCPEHSVGHLCASVPKSIESDLEAALTGKASFVNVNRLCIDVSGTRTGIPFALNDILFCHKHPAATSRYQISLHTLNDSSVPCEKQHSSGVWVAAPAGATAAIRSYELPVPELTDSKFLFAVRELYFPPGESYSLMRQTLDGKKHELSFFCRMRQGMVCIDGPDSSVPVGFGETIKISMPECASIRIAKPSHHWRRQQEIL